MIICPECGEENPQESKFCRKCGINLVYEEPEPEKKESTAKKVTVEDSNGPIRTTVNTNSSSTNTQKNDSKWWACCICIIFLFIIFAILGH